ncbi:hypothetical protein Pcinc_035311, partial [Petrolisthes cinctipes]
AVAVAVEGGGVGRNAEEDGERKPEKKTMKRKEQKGEGGKWEQQRWEKDVQVDEAKENGIK